MTRRSEPCGRRFLLLAAVLSTFLPACSRFSGRAEGFPPAPADAVSAPEGIERWRAIGKIAFRAGDERFSASFDWRQVRERFRLRLSGPFGGGALQVEGRPGRVELTAASGERTTARTPEALLARRLGWELPASSLRHWITGRAHPAAPVRDRKLDAAGRLESLEQQGWIIAYRYPGDARADSLPERITLRGEGLSGRVVVRTWRVGPHA